MGRASLYIQTASAATAQPVSSYFQWRESARSAEAGFVRIAHFQPGWKAVGRRLAVRESPFPVSLGRRASYFEPTPRIAESDGTSNDIQTTSKRHPEVLIKWADSAVSLLGRPGCRGPTPLKPHRHPVFGEIHEVPHFRRVSVKHIGKPKAGVQAEFGGFQGKPITKSLLFSETVHFPKLDVLDWVRLFCV